MFGHRYTEVGTVDRRDHELDERRLRNVPVLVMTELFEETFGGTRSETPVSSLVLSISGTGVP